MRRMTARRDIGIHGNVKGGVINSEGVKLEDFARHTVGVQPTLYPDPVQFPICDHRLPLWCFQRNIRKSHLVGLQSQARLISYRRM